MLFYCNCKVYCETTGRGRNSMKRWVIRDMAWGGKLIASFTDAEFFAKDNHGENKVNETQIILDWVAKRDRDPAYLAYKASL